MNKNFIGYILSIMSFFSISSNELFSMHEKTQYTLDNGFFVKHECLSIDDDGEFVGDDESIYIFQLTLFSVTKEKIGYLEFEVNEQDNSSEALFLSILKENHRRQGHATRLLNLVFKILKQRNINQVALEVEPKNKPAQYLYAKIGFIVAENRSQDFANNQHKRIKLIKII